MNFDEYLLEATSEEQKIQEFSDAIAEKIIEVEKYSKTSVVEKAKSIQQLISLVITAPGTGNQVVMRKYEKYLPSDYEKYKDVMENPDGNKYDSPFWKMNDNRQFTIYRKSLQNYAKKNGIEIPRGNLI